MNETLMAVRYNLDLHDYTDVGLENLVCALQELGQSELRTLQRQKLLQAAALLKDLLRTANFEAKTLAPVYQHLSSWLALHYPEK